GDHQFRVATAIDYPDLFHFHLRYPNQLAFVDLADFMNSRTYHLQYHAAEHVDLMEIQWLHAILAVNDSPSAAWAQQRLRKATTPPSTYIGSGLYQPAPLTPLAELDDTGMKRLAELWNQQLQSISPGVPYLTLRIQALNDPARGVRALSE